MPHQRMAALDALRGFACLWIVLHHAFEGATGLPWPLQIFCQLGWLGVSLFLVISGFCLYYPLVRVQEPEHVHVSLRHFFPRRAWRILPPYLCSLFVALVLRAHFLHQTGHPHTELLSPWYDLPLHLFLLQNLRTDTFASLSSTTWSLALEWQLYLIFPVLVTLAARRGIRTVLLATLGITLLWQGLACLHLGVSSTWSPRLAVVYHALPGRVFEFACGMLAALCVVRPAQNHKATARLFGGLCLIPALLIVVFFYRLGPLCDPLWGVVFTSGLVSMSDIQPRRFLARVLVVLGQRSYSIYLIHLLVMLALPLPAQLVNLPLFTGIFRTITAILAGIVFYSLVERPFLRSKN